jgi:CBS domain-containing protein
MMTLSLLWSEHMRVGNFMSKRVVTVRPDSPVSEAARLMLESDISGLPVIGADGDLVGIITEHDLLRRQANGPGSQPPHWLQLMIEGTKISDESARFHEARVEQVMTRDPLTVTEDTPIAEACRLIEERSIKRLPVVRDGRLVGVISRADLIRALTIAVRRIIDASQRAEYAEAAMTGLQRESILHRARTRP